MRGLDPNDFVDVDEAFEDDYPEDEITYAGFTVVPGDEVDHASLGFWKNGVSFLGGDTGTNWEIDLYSGYHFNGQALPISEAAARHVLENLSGTTNLEDYDWAAQNWAYFE